MARRKQTRGTCAFCGREMTRGGFSRHLPACPGRIKAISEADRKAGAEETLIHLQVRDAWAGNFWLHLEMRGSATLSDLDGYLRAIWLECCGHLSQFSFGGWSGEEIPMGTRAERVFQPGVELTHIYDFGTSSETLIKVVRRRSGKPFSVHPIVLMARNNPPQFTCMECDRPASWLCMECVYDDKPGTLCDEHAEDHPCEEYGGLFPLVNSPRVGMCGYTGPAEPPY